MTPPARGHGADDEIYARRRRKRKRVARKSHRRRAVVFALAAVVALLFVVAGAAVTGVATFGASCDLNSLQQVEIGSNTFIYAADNSRLGVIPAERNRQPVPLERITPWMPKATVAIEDRRFYSHDGVDVEGIARALWKNVNAGHVVEGGSTITQQLVRNLYIGREQTVERKVKEACLALKLDKARTKDWILATYMNQVYYGNLAYGIEAAAQTYFSKNASELNLPEAALLAGMPQAPSDYNPFSKKDVATARRNQVLRALLNEGKIDRGQYDWAVSRGLGLKAGRLYKEIREPDFFGYVRDQLIAQYGAGTVRSGGLKVYTTIDPRFQRAAQKAIRDTLYESDDPAAGVISINPKNGAIRAMTAVFPGNKKNQFNLLSQARRQSGSTFKTFVLAAAVEKGINPDTTSYLSSPFYYRPDPSGNCEDGSWWCVETYGHSYLGWTSISRATLSSDNTVYAQLTLDVTPEAVAKMATKLGVRSALDVDGAFVPSIGLGALEVSPLDMASAYATLAAGGIYSEPMAIRKVILPTGEDKQAGWGKPKRKRVISDGVADAVTRILEQNIDYGTGTGADFGQPAAGKTGTTEEHSDAWFCGYTPRLGTTVWVGYPRGKIPMVSVHGISVSGGTFPAQIWRLFMSSAIGQLEPVEFPEPEDEPEWVAFERGQYARSFGYYEDDDDNDYYAPPAAGEPTPPAEIWRLFMSSAIGQLEPEPFPEPLDLPEWTTFERGQYARSFGSYDSGYRSDDDDDAATTAATSPAEPTTSTTVPDAPPA
ncbi:MAG: transglycosylase domain-containing protein, partial [Gaiellaceae bacterium]